MLNLNHKRDLMKYCALFIMVLGLSACGDNDNKVDTKIEPIIRILIDSPVNGVSYSCDGVLGITKNGGQFTCESAPVTFSLGGLTLGTINSFNNDNNVFPQDFSEVGRENFSDIKTIKLARLLQSFDDDGDISEAIDIPSSIADKFNNILNIDDSSLSELTQMAGVDLVSEAYAISHLKRSLAGGVGHSNYRIHIDLTDATPNDSITTDVVLTIKGAEVFSGDEQLGSTLTLDGLLKKAIVYLKNPPEIGQDIRIITRAKGYVDSGSSIALSTDRHEYTLNLKLVKDAQGVIAPGVYSSDIAIANMVNGSGLVTEAIVLESKESEFKPGVKLTIPVDTVFTDKDGNPVKGTELKITSFNPYESDAIAAYPGGLNVIADASGFAINGELQAGNREINFKSAGFVAISITDTEGNKVKSFSQDIEVAMQFAIGTKDGEGNEVVISDEVPIWSYDEDTGKWSYEKVGIVQDLNLSDGLYDVVYSLNHLSYWNLDWHFGDKCSTSNFYFKDLDGSPHAVSRFSYQLTVYSSPSIDTWITTIDSDSFLSFYNAPVGFSGVLKVWTKDKAVLLSSLAFTDTCSTTDHELIFEYDDTSYDYEAALRLIDELNNRGDKSIGIRPIFKSLEYLQTVVDILDANANVRDSVSLFQEITAVALEYSSAFINADGYEGITINEYGCDPAQEYYVDELKDNLHYQTIFNGSLANDFNIILFPYIESASIAFLEFSPSQLAYSIYGIPAYVKCGLRNIDAMIAFGDETNYETRAISHIETVILANVASMKGDIEDELASEGKVSYSSAATFEFVIKGALTGASEMASNAGALSSPALTTINDALAYLNVLKSTGKVDQPCEGEECSA